MSGSTGCNTPREGQGSGVPGLEVSGVGGGGGGGGRGGGGICVCVLSVCRGVCSVVGVCWVLGGVCGCGCCGWMVCVWR